MEFGDLKTDSGRKALNDYLEDKSYIEGHTPTQADAVIFSALGNFSEGSFSHLNRWYNHIKSYGKDINNFPGQKKAASSSASGAAAQSVQKGKNKGKSDKTDKSKTNANKDEAAAQGGGDDKGAEMEALRSTTNPDGTPKNDGQIKKDLKKLEKLEKFMAKQAKLEAAKAQKDSKPKAEEVGEYYYCNGYYIVWCYWFRS